MVERSLFSVVTQSYLLNLRDIALNTCLVLALSLEPKWSQAVQSEPAEICLNFWTPLSNPTVGSVSLRVLVSIWFALSRPFASGGILSKISLYEMSSVRMGRKFCSAPTISLSRSQVCR